jgi:hypothetical protein
VSFDYTEIREVADEVIEAFGQAATLRRFTRGTYNPETGGYSGGSTADTAVKVVVTEYAKNMVDGALILATDRRVLLSAQDLSIEPNPKNDKLVVGGTVYEIVRSDPLSPGGTVVLYELQVRTT